MNRTVSIYLDLVRFAAAIVVVLAHLTEVLAPDLRATFPGREAVVVFFVMSGYVISYASLEKERTLGRYAFNRATRLYSVAIPALLLGAALTCCIDVQITAAFPLQSTGQQLAIAVLANLVFLGQSWTNSIDAPLSSAYWSLNYEVWYYAMFGAWIFLRPGRRWLVCLLLAAMAGPKILAMLPCWAIGALAYRYRHRLGMPPPLATVVLVVAAVIAFMVTKTGLSVTARTMIAEVWRSYPMAMGGSNKAPTDLLIALCFAASIAAVESGVWPSRLLLGIGAPVKWCADRTLSIYLFHAPVFAFLYAGLHLRGWTAVGAEVAAILLLAEVTERRLGPLRRLLWAMPRPGTRTIRPPIG